MLRTGIGLRATDVTTSTCSTSGTARAQFQRFRAYIDLHSAATGTLRGRVRTHDRSYAEGGAPLNRSFPCIR